MILRYTLVNGTRSLINTDSLILWMVALIGPSSMTSTGPLGWFSQGAIKRPSEVPPEVLISVVMPVSDFMALSERR